MRFLALWIMLWLGTFQAVAAPAVWFTADTEGHTQPCAVCPVHVGLGGLARRATLIASARGHDNQLLLLDAGNFLFGPDSIDSGGHVMVEAYAALGYTAVNLSYRDFRFGRAYTLDLLKQGKLEAISANLLDDASGKPLVKPFVVVNANGQRIAMIGLSDPPIGWQRLAQLKQQLTGIRVVPASEAMAEWLPKAKAQADQVMVLYYGNRSGLAHVLGKAGREVVGIAVGGVSEDDLPRQFDVPLIAPEIHGKSLGRLTLESGAPPKTDSVLVTPDVVADPAMQKLLAAYVPPIRPMEVVAATQPASQTATVSIEGPATSRPATQMVAATVNPPTSVPSSGAGATSAVVVNQVKAHSDRQPRGLEGVGLTADQVNQSIERGRDFLWEHLRAQLAKENRHLGDDIGYDLLQALALVHAGAHLKYKEFDTELRGMLTRIDPANREIAIYPTGIACMLIGDYGDPVFFPKLRLLARSLIEQQLGDGSWDYGNTVKKEAYPDSTTGSALSVEGGAIDPTIRPPPMQRISPWSNRSPGDNSTTQFALLGLRAASRARITADADLWRRNLQVCRKRQCKDGSWGYNDESAGYGSMTCAGLCALAIDRYELGEKDPPDDVDIERGLAWLEKNFSVTSNPARGSYLYYYLYSLERIGRILDTEFIGQHEWYPQGAKFLVSSQQKNGSWLELPDVDPRTPTSFALLFLTRATQTLKIEQKHGGAGKLETAVATPPPARLYVVLDASGSMIDTIDGRSKFDIAREAVSSMLDSLPDSAEVALRVYGHRKRALEPEADQDSNLEFPMAKIDRPKLAALLKSLRARGKTPLALSLSQARQDMAYIGNQPVTLVLLTDGGEDTLPRRNPIKAAAELKSLGGLTFHIVGFDINNPDWGTQLRAMAVASGGTYWPAARAAALMHNLRSAIFGIPDDYALFDSTAHEVTRGAFGESKTLPEGKYKFKTRYAGHDFSTDLWVNTDSSTSVVFDASQARGSATTQAEHPTTQK